MATRKLSPSLFYAKAGITPTEGSTQYFHFIADVRPKTKSVRLRVRISAAPDRDEPRTPQAVPSL